MQRLHLIVHHPEVAAKVAKCPVLVYLGVVPAALIGRVQATRVLNF